MTSTSTRVTAVAATSSGRAWWQTKTAIAVLAVALIVAALHMAPFLILQARTPAGWTFTGNTSNSPDHMQYRVWYRASQQSGILVKNTFTNEPNSPHLPVLFYYALGQMAQGLNAPPEYLYWYVGAVLAFALAIVLFLFVRQFFREQRQTWPVFLVILFGGGLGALLQFLQGIGFVRNNFLLRRTLVEGVWAWPLFEEYRGNYLFLSLFDSHYLWIWLGATAALLAFYLTLRRYSHSRLLITTLLFALLTFSHVYEGVTLVAIAATIIALLAWKRLLRRDQVASFVVLTLVVVGCLAAQLLLYRSSGLPLPDWRGVNILLSTVLLAYPLAWLLLAIGFLDFWRRADFDRIFLVGWAAACTIIIFSGPFYPYPDRGTMTYQIPLYIIAGLIYFSRSRRLTPVAALAAVLLVGWTPAWKLDGLVERWQSPPLDAPAVYMSPDHTALVEALTGLADAESILIVDKAAPPWKTDDLWLAPEFPGRLYCGHFFLTIDYEQKCERVNRFYRQNDPPAQAAFLQEQEIRFVYVSAGESVERFTAVPGLSLLASNDVGALFEYTEATTNDDSQ